MAELFNFKSKVFEDVPDESVSSAIQSGRFGFRRGSRIPVINLDGESGTMDATEAPKALQEGFSYDTSSMREDRRLEKEFGDGIINDMRAGALGAARGLTFGLSDVALTETGIAEKKTLEEIKKRNPVASFSGEAGGIIIPAIFSGGASIGAKIATKAGTGVLAAELASKKAGQLATRALLGRKAKDSAVRTLTEKGVTGAAEAGLFGTGQLISEHAIGDAELNAESALAMMGPTVLFGGALGGGLSLTGRAINKTAAAAKSKVANAHKRFAGISDDNLKKTFDKRTDLVQEAKSSYFGRKAKHIKAAMNDVEGDPSFGRATTFGKNTEVKFDPDLIEGNILDLRDAKQRASLGRRLEIEGLDKWDSDSVTMDRLATERVRQLSIAGERPILSKIKRDTQEALNEFDLVLSKTKAELKNIDLLDNAVLETISKRKGAPFKGGTLGDRHFIKSLGATKKHFKKLTAAKQAELGDFIKRHMKNSGKGLGALGTDLDDYYMNIHRTLDDSFDGMQEAVLSSMQQVDLAQVPASKQLTGEKIADYIDRTWGQKFRINGKVIPKMEKIAAEVDDFSDRMRHFKVEPSEIGPPKQVPFTVKEMRSMRKTYDSIIKDFNNQLPETRSMIRDVRFKMENDIVDLMDHLSDKSGKDISKLYKDSKREYHLASMANEILEDTMAGAAGNNLIPLTGYISASAGAQAGGIGGAIAAAGGRTLAKKYGDNALALVLSKVQNNQVNALTKTSKAVDGFFNKKTAGVKSALINATTTKYEDKSYKEVAKEIEDFNSNVGARIEEMQQNNQLLQEAAPDTTEFLQNKIIQSSSFLMEKLPQDRSPMPEFSDWEPSRSEMDKFNRYRRAVEDPSTMLDSLEQGYMSTEEIEVLNEIYPSLKDLMEMGVVDKMATEKLNYSQKVQLKNIFGIVTDTQLQPLNLVALQQMNMAKRLGTQRAQPTVKADKLKAAGRAQTPGDRILSKT